MRWILKMTEALLNISIQTSGYIRKYLSLILKITYFSLTLPNGILGYKLIQSNHDAAFNFLGTFKAPHISSYLELFEVNVFFIFRNPKFSFQTDNWKDVRYKLIRNNQRCFNDVSNNVQCQYLEFEWDEIEG